MLEDNENNSLPVIVDDYNMIAFSNKSIENAQLKFSFDEKAVNKRVYSYYIIAGDRKLIT